MLDVRQKMLDFEFIIHGKMANHYLEFNPSIII